MNTRLSRYSLPATLIAYFAVFGYLIIRSHGLPYVIDNNESFSSLHHAYNLFHFDFFKSFGLTDESFTPFAAGHPFVHTHQGNFPRLFAFLIYIFGARGIESQIAVTTFTAGLGSIVFTHRYFCKIANPLFALVACLLFVTDYMMYAQWQIVTYRVWYGFFFFSSLLCVHALPKSKTSRGWLGLILANFACLGYFESTFALFVNLVAAFYAGLLYFQDRRTILRSWILQFTGGLLGVAVLIAQLTAYMGFSEMIRDARFTFLARSFETNPQAKKDALDFYNRRHIIFWQNYFDARHLRTAKAFLTSLFTYQLEVYTPAFIFISMVLVAACLIRAWRPKALFIPVRFMAVKLPLSTRRLARLTLSLGLAASTVWLGFSWFGSSPIGLQPGIPLPVSAVDAFIGMGCLTGVALLIYFSHAADPHRRLGAGSIFGLILLFATYAWLMHRQSRFYDQAYAPFWEYVLWGGPATYCVRVAGGVALALATLAVCRTGFRMRDPLLASRGFRPLMRFWIAAFAAFGVTYYVFPGYLHSGYLYRTAPFLVFAITPVIALSLYLPLNFIRAGALLWRTKTNFTASRRLGGVTAVLAAALFAFQTLSWLRVQKVYLGLYPPDRYDSIRQLRDTPYAGATFITNQYAAPISQKTGSWAYDDPLFIGRSLSVDEHGYRPEQDLKSFLWFADRDVNPAYLKPEYFFFLPYRDYQSLPELLRFHARQISHLSGCASDSPIFQLALRNTGTDAFPRDELMGRDPSPLDSWAIFKIDWDFPPLLTPFSADDPPAERASFPLVRPVSLNHYLRLKEIGHDSRFKARDFVHFRVVRGGGPRRALVDYRYFQQEGVREGSSTLRLYSAGKAGLTLLKVAPAAEGLILPRATTGAIVISVTPASASRRSEFEFFSPVQVVTP